MRLVREVPTNAPATGARCWTQISTMPTGLQMRFDLQIHSRCCVVTDSFQDAKLLHAVLTHGTNWATIAHSHRPNRTTLALRNRYSTLRLQNNNTRSKANTETTEKATKTASSTSQTTMGNSLKETDWNMEASRCPTWNGGDMVNQSSDEDDGDEDDGDEDEEDDNEDNENEDDGLHQNNNTSAMKGILNSQAPSHDTSGKGIQTPESTFASWDTWVAGSMETNNVFDFKMQPLSTDNLEMDKANQMQYQSLLGLNSSQYPTPGESYFSNISEPGNLDTIVPKSLYGKSLSIRLRIREPLIESDLDPTPMDINLTPSLDTFCTSPQPQTAPSTTSNTTGAGASPGRASSVGITNSKGTSITSAGGGKSPSTSPSNLSLDLPSTTLYQVSISMTCTRAQLDANMILLAGLGSSVTIQIDKKA